MKTITRISFLLTVLSLLVILSGCVSPEAPVQNKTPVSAPTPLTQTKLDLEIGDIAKLPGMEATVTKVQKTDSVSYSSGGQNINVAAGGGYVLVVADFWIKNTGNKTISYTNNPFGLRDNAGFNYNSIIYGGYDGIGLLNDTYPNQTKRGREVFKVPTEAHGFNLYLDTNSFKGPDFASLPIKVKSISWWPR